MPGGRTLKGRFQFNTVSRRDLHLPGWKSLHRPVGASERNGRATLKSPRGGLYDGEFKERAAARQGVMTWPSGRRYEGDL